MSDGMQSQTADDVEPAPEERPTVTCCETSPDRTVFMEADNSDGWLSSDLVVDVTR